MHSQFIPATGAESLFLLINIFDVSTRSHYAFRIMAMNQSKCVTKFVDNFFLKTINKKLVIASHSISFITKAVKRGDAGASI